MLKIASRNEKLNRRMAQKEMISLLHKLFHCFFGISRNTKKFPKRLSFDATPTQIKAWNLFTQNKKWRSQFFRYTLDWQAKFLYQASFTKSRTICFLTGRSRSVYRAFKLSRSSIRSYAASGCFIGLSKASW